MTYKYIEMPDDGQLAVCDRDMAVEPYLSVITATEASWKAKKAEAEAAIDMPRYFAAHLVHTQLDQGLQLLGEKWLYEDSEVLDAIRRTTLGAVGVAKLLDRLIAEDEQIIDGIDLSHAESLVLVDLTSGLNAKPNQGRVHITEADADDCFGGPVDEFGETWYLDPEAQLYVQRIFPAQPTQGLLDEVRRLGQDINQFRIQTLFPYIASCC